MCPQYMFHRDRETQVSISGCKSLHVCVNFTTPLKAMNRVWITLFFQLNKACISRHLHIWIAGDMNLPECDWKSNCLKPSCHHLVIKNTVNAVVLNDHSLYFQMVSEPTWGENTLDLFITNNESHILKLKIIPGISDHDGIVYIEADIKAW